MKTILESSHSKDSFRGLFGGRAYFQGEMFGFLTELTTKCKLATINRFKC